MVAVLFSYPDNQTPNYKTLAKPSSQI